MMPNPIAPLVEIGGDLAAVDPPKITARWMNAAGEELHKVEISSKDLSP